MRFHILLPLGMGCMASPCKPGLGSSVVTTSTSELSFSESTSVVSSVTWSTSSTTSIALETLGTSTIASTESSDPTSSVTLSALATEMTSLETSGATSIASTVSADSTDSVSTILSASSLITESASPTTETNSLFTTTTDSSDIATSLSAATSSALASTTIASESTDLSTTSILASTSTSDPAISTTSISTTEAETSFTAVSTTDSTTTSQDTTTTEAAALPTFKAVVQNAPGSGYAIGRQVSAMGYGPAWKQIPLMTIEPGTGHLVMDGNARACASYWYNGRDGYARLNPCVEPMPVNSAYLTCELDNAGRLKCSIPALTCYRDSSLAIICTDTGAKWTKFYAESIVAGISWLVSLGDAAQKSSDLSHGFDVSAQII